MKSLKKVSIFLSTLLIATCLSFVNANSYGIPFVNSISVSAETTSSGLEYQFNYNHTEVSVAGYTGTSSTLTIPSVIVENGVSYPVTFINHYAFENNTTLKRVYISENMKTIGYNSFKNSNITYISIPSSVTTIQGSAFSDCTKLTEISFATNSQLSRIEIGCFYNCSSLSSIAIPDNVDYIYENSFKGCTNLKTVSFNYLSSKLTAISQWCFLDCYNLENITLPKSIKDISIGAFQNCASLKSITIPENVDRVYNDSFNGCTSLESLTFAGSSTQDLNVYKTAFQNLPALKTVTINKYKSLTFEENTFANCNNLNTVNFPISSSGSIDIAGITFGTGSFAGTPVYNLMKFIFPNI